MAGNRKFITEEAFTKMVAVNREKDEVCNWADLSKNVIYLITRIQECYSVQYDGACWLLCLQNRQGDFVKVWAPKKLVTDIKERRKETEQVFMKSLGQVKYGHKTSNEFDLCFEDTAEPIQLFHTE